VRVKTLKNYRTNSLADFRRELKETGLLEDYQLALKQAYASLKQDIEIAAEFNHPPHLVDSEWHFVQDTDASPFAQPQAPTLKLDLKLLTGDSFELYCSADELLDLQYHLRTILQTATSRASLK
jgi:hypothetical protein